LKSYKKKFEAFSATSPTTTTKNNTFYQNLKNDMTNESLAIIVDSDFDNDEDGEENDIIEVTNSSSDSIIKINKKIEDKMIFKVQFLLHLFYIMMILSVYDITDTLNMNRIRNFQNDGLSKSLLNLKNKSLIYNNFLKTINDKDETFYILQNSGLIDNITKTSNYEYEFRNIFFEQLITHSKIQNYNSFNDQINSEKTLEVKIQKKKLNFKINFILNF
jgi:hypothetical protein